MKNKDLVFITTAFDDSRIYALRADVTAICAKCKDCDGENPESGAGCLTAFHELCYLNKKFIYKKE